MREASARLVTGHIALWVCLCGTLAVMQHAGTNASFVVSALLLFALLFGYLGWLFWAIRRIKGQRLKSLVKVTYRGDEKFHKAAAGDRKAVLYFFGIWLYSMLCGIGWSFALQHMSITTILASLAIFPLMGIGYFVYRVVKYAFWEYFLFAHVYRAGLHADFPSARAKHRAKPPGLGLGDRWHSIASSSLGSLVTFAGRLGN